MLKVGVEHIKNLLLLCGPNEIGKTSVSREIVELLPNSAYVDSDSCRIMNPFVLDEDTIPTISKNISDMILNYFHCPVIETVIFTYGFHGRRREVFEKVIRNISGYPYRSIPYLLWCDEEENIRRMKKDGRDMSRIERTISQSRKAYNDVLYKRIDTTDLSIQQQAKFIIVDAGLLDK